MYIHISLLGMPLPNLGETKFQAKSCEIDVMIIFLSFELRNIPKNLVLNIDSIYHLLKIMLSFNSKHKYKYNPLYT